MNRTEPRPLNERIGLHIKAARAIRGATQSDLSKATGIPLSTLRAYEQGKLPLPLDRLMKIADALDVDLSGLLPKRDAR